MEVSCDAVIIIYGFHSAKLKLPLAMLPVKPLRRLNA